MGSYHFQTVHVQIYYTFNSIKIILYYIVIFVLPEQVYNFNTRCIFSVCDRKKDLPTFFSFVLMKAVGFYSSRKHEFKAYCHCTGKHVLFCKNILEMELVEKGAWVWEAGDPRCWSLQTILIKQESKRHSTPSFSLPVSCWLHYSGERRGGENKVECQSSLLVHEWI